MKPCRMQHLKPRNEKSHAPWRFRERPHSARTRYGSAHTTYLQRLSVSREKPPRRSLASERPEMLNVITLYQISAAAVPHFVSSLGRGGEWNMLVRRVVSSLIATDALEHQASSSVPGPSV